MNENRKLILRFTVVLGDGKSLGGKNGFGENAQFFFRNDPFRKGNFDRFPFYGAGIGDNGADTFGIEGFQNLIVRPDGL